MKRFTILTFIFVLISTYTFAQIRMEKRHYNRGWYIALSKDKKEKQEARVTEKKIYAIAKPVEETTSAFTSNESIAQNEVVAESVASKQVVVEKKETPKKSTLMVKTPVVQAAQPIVQPVKYVVRQVQSVKKQDSFSRTAASDPGDGLFGNLFDGDGTLLIILSILGAIGIVAFFLGLYVMYGLEGIVLFLCIAMVSIMGTMMQNYR